MRKLLLTARFSVLFTLIVATTGGQAQLPADSPQWDYTTTSRLEELKNLGSEGWELVTQAEVTMKGGITGAVKGELTTCFFKRPA